MLVDAAPDRSGAGRIVLVVVAALVWLLTAVAIVGGVLLIVRHASFWAVNAGIGLLLLVILLRPRLGRTPRRSSAVSRASAPHLWRLVDEVATRLDAPAPDRLVLDLGYRASITRAGLRGRIVLRLGAELWVALEPDQRVALLAHEFGCLVSGDPERIRLVRPVLDTFGKLASLPGARTSLRSVWSANLSRINVVGLLVATVQWLLGRLFATAYLGLRALALPGHLRAEYLADVRAAELAGTSAALGWLDRLRLETEIRSLLYHAAADRSPEQWGGGVYALVAMRTRSRAPSADDELSLWSTRPLAARRSELLTARPWREPVITLDSDAVAALDRELTSWRDALRENLLGMREFVAR